VLLTGLFCSAKPHVLLFRKGPGDCIGVNRVIFSGIDISIWGFSLKAQDSLTKLLQKCNFSVELLELTCKTILENFYIFPKADKLYFFEY
jgi:hypothetical protein